MYLPLPEGFTLSCNLLLGGDPLRTSQPPYNTRMHKEMNYKYILTVAVGISISGFLSGFLSGCGLPMWANVAHTIGDVVLSVKTGKSSTEHGLSALTGKNCQFIRVIDGQDICMSSEDYTLYLLSLNCDIYAWNVLNRVYCKKT